MASSYVPSLMKDEEPRNWADLPSELTSSILNRLGVIDILENAQKVCRPWRRVCKDPLKWRKILGGFATKYDLEIMCRHAVDRSQGGLVEIEIWDFGTDDLLYYIAERSSNLRSLRLAICKQITDEGVAKAVLKLPLLAELDVSYCAFLGDSLNVVGQSCPNLKTLKLNRSPALEFFDRESNNIAVKISETMPELRHLQLFGSGLSNTGLNAILDGCPYLEHLDLRRCFNIKHVGAIQKQFSERSRVLRHPCDSTADFPFEVSSFTPDCSDYDSDNIYGCYDSESDVDYDYDFSCLSPSDYYSD